MAKRYTDEQLMDLGRRKAVEMEYNKAKRAADRHVLQEVMKADPSKTAYDLRMEWEDVRRKVLEKEEF